MDTLTALGVPARRQIVELLAAQGRMSATEISLHFTMTPSAISQHLKVLREAGLIRQEKQAQQRFYQLNPDSMMDLAKWTLQQIQRLDRFEAVLMAEKLKAFGPSNAQTDLLPEKGRSHDS